MSHSSVMINCKHRLLSDVRLVGDPIDVVTGANVEVNCEFQLRAPLPLLWCRHYDSSQSGHHYALGWGHTHYYDRHLQYDLDGLRYTAPLGKLTSFPPLLRDGERRPASGLVLHRVTPQLYHIYDSDGSVMEFEFRDLQLPASLQALRRGNGTIRFGYTGEGHLDHIVDSRGRFIRAQCDAFGRILHLVLAADRQPDRTLIACRYDAAGNLVEGIDAYGHSFRFSYDPQNRLISRTDRRGYSFFYEYDTQGRCIHSRGEDGLHAVWLRYLTLERATIVTKADKGQWTYLYDESGVITKIIDPYGGVRSFNVDAYGRVAEEIDPNGDVTQWVYGQSSQLLGKRSSLGHFSQDGSAPLRPDQCAHRVPERPSEWEYGHLLTPARLRSPAMAPEAVLPAPIQRLVGYVLSGGTDALGSSEATRGPGPRSRQVYDELGVLVREIGPDGSARHWSYDAGGNTVRYHDFDGSVIQCEYTSWDLPSRRTDAIGRTVMQRFTTSAQIAELVDLGGVRSSYVYDLKERLAEFWHDGIRLEQYRYDASDNLTAKLDGTGQAVVTQEIGPKNLKTVRHLASGETHRFLYTERGYYAGVATDDVNVRFDYDQFLNRTLDERDGRGVEHRFSGPNSLVQTTIFQRFTTQYQWLSKKSLQIRDPGGKTHDIHLLGGGVVLRSMSGGLSEVARYDEVGRCHAKASSQLRGRGAGAPWVRYFWYSGEGDLLGVRDSAAGAIRYGYDAAHRLREEIAANGTRATFRYDAGDNLVAQPGLTDVSIASGNRLRSANGDDFEYDYRGNLSVRRGHQGITRYRYDSRNMLVSCETERGVWRATYDPLGRRVRTWFGDEWQEFYWDTDRLAAELRHDGRLRIYVYADAFAMVPLLWLDYHGPDAAPSAGQRYFVLCNHLGTPVCVENEAGEVMWRAQVAPYGSIVAPEIARMDMPLRFPGHYFDTETGLHYNRFRYYSPQLGRYLQPDPLRTSAGNNLYAYTTNPLKAVDVRGTCPTDGTTTDKQETTEDGDPADESQRLPLSREEAEAECRARTAEALAAFEAEIQAGNLTRRELGPVVAGVLDRTTGEFFAARNHDGPPEPMHPVIETRVNAAQQNRQHDDVNGPGNHAEVHALNDALNARGPGATEADIGDMTQQTVWTRGSGQGHMAKGNDAPRCGDCQNVTNGVDNLSGDAPSRPPSPSTGSANGA